MNNRAVIKRIRKIEEKIAPKPRDDPVVIWSFGSDDEPHGKYGYRKLHIHTREKEACTEEEEMKLLQEAYERIPRNNGRYMETTEAQTS